jgi:Ethanolamine utilization protein EutJ (predicted chaperonin)
MYQPLCPNLRTHALLARKTPDATSRPISRGVNEGKSAILAVPVPAQRQPVVITPHRIASHEVSKRSMPQA